MLDKLVTNVFFTNAFAVFSKFNNILVVSCDLIPIMWVMLLVHTSILANKQNSYNIPPPFTFNALKLWFYVLKQNVPLYITLTYI